jgi:protein tyrosine phosphatase
LYSLFVSYISSAGVGRTGTYIGLDILTQEGKDKGYVDVFDCVNKMRHQRVNMVQTAVS